MQFEIGDKRVGQGQPVYIVGEIGINHNGDVEIAKQLIDVAVAAGLDAVKFQKRTPELCVPRDQWVNRRDTPWGVMSYIDYRQKLELDHAQYQIISDYCDAKGLVWFASPWDEQSVDFLTGFDLPCYKVASASVTDHGLLEKVVTTAAPIILSTGMSTLDQIRRAVEIVDVSKLVICHSTSTYPCPPQELNLRMINTLAQEFNVPIGYSGHEVDLASTLAAVSVGACLIERHITLDRTMWGSDQAALLEPGEVIRLVQGIRLIESVLGDGIKKIYPSEMIAMKKLRRSR